MAHVEPLREGDPAVVGAYRLLGLLGAGGQGTVYLGRAPDGRTVAVKVLRHGAGPDERFAKEIEAARRVEPFCIAQVLDASPGPQPYIVTEYVEGPSLQQAGRHTGADLQRLAVATATALAAIHQAGVVHRDFKPANVLLGPGGPRVIDFGIARAADASATMTSGIVGTPAYMAPEQLAGQMVGPPADVFAWAAVVVWAGTGTPPFGQDTLPAIINRILNNEPQLGDLPRPLRSIVYDCLAKDPAARPTMRDVLLRLLGGDAPTPAHPSQLQGPRHPTPSGAMGQGPPPGPAPVGGAGQGPAPFPGPGGRRHGRGRGVVPLAAGLSVVVAAALVGGVVWLAPWSHLPGLSALTAPSATPTPPTSTPRKTQRKSTPKPATTKKPTSRPTTRRPTESATPRPTVTRTTTRSTPTPTRTTKKPVTTARAGVGEITLSGGPGQSAGSGCYMPPLHFQGRVESTKREIWVSYAWLIDGRSVERSRSWVSEDDYSAYITAGQYMLKAGPHTVTLRVTAPSAATKSVSLTICTMDD
ncbi:serine/threonine-protein kinase [Nonomuraea sp. NPDC051191]|uniref:serine/threonine-protein kinase n=1 Tax=Nonomuraea sp. NPDC051191 TaxID=3364372 RepID=UPI00379EA618